MTQIQTTTLTTGFMLFNRSIIVFMSNLNQNKEIRPETTVFSSALNCAGTLTFKVIIMDWTSSSGERCVHLVQSNSGT